MLAFPLPLLSTCRAVTLLLEIVVDLMMHHGLLDAVQRVFGFG
jgi:hypothetical protein